ncbi:MAG: hypothetical protein GC171_12135 [Terrimonas sp.]|nr:hypothetical protein [Terrimonas sp.]
MKIFFISLAFMLIAPLSYTQQKKTAIPNTAMQQQINEVKNDIRELEAEIKEAEKNDPDEVAELKNQLAVMKKMLAMMDPSSSPSSPVKPVKKTVAPASQYQSPVLPVYLKQPVTAPTASQARNRLLWYTGKKINDSTLITMKGLVVQYNKKTGRLKLQPDKKTDPFNKIVKELDKSDQRKNELIDMFIKMKNGALYYPDLVNALALYDDITKRYGAGLKNYIDIPQIFPQTVAAVEYYPAFYAGRGPNLSKIITDTVPDKFLQEMGKKINELLKKADAMEKSLPPVDAFLPPPLKDLSICSSCDSGIIKKEEIEDSIWHKKFSGAEEEIMQIRLGLARQMALMGMDDEKIMRVILETKVPARMLQKARILYDRYGKDPRYIKTVAPIILGIERQHQLLGITEGMGDNILASLLSFDYEKYMREQMGLKNYNLVLNLAQHIGWLRQKALLGAADDANASYSKLKPYLDFNRFNLSLDLDFIYEQKNDDELEMRASGKIATKDKVYVQLYLDDCTWRMRLWNPDYFTAKADEMAMPLLVNSGQKTIREENDKMATYPYSGPSKVMAQFPDFKISFCNNGQSDTAIMTTLNYPVDGDIPVQTSFKTYKAELLALANHMFIDINKLEGHESEGMNMALDIMTSLSQPQVTNPTGNPKLDKLQSDYHLRKTSDDFKKQVSTTGLTEKSVFLFQANNGSSVLIDKTNDTKHRIDENSELTKGVIHLRVVHDPVTEN